jgi:hypothetical protein
VSTRAQNGLYRLLAGVIAQPGVCLDQREDVQRFEYRSRSITRECQNRVAVWPFAVLKFRVCQIGRNLLKGRQAVESRTDLPG